MRCKRLKWFSRVAAFLALTIATTLLGASALFAQANPAAEETGFTAFEGIRGSTSNQGQFMIFDTSLGYDFNRHVGMDLGVPVYLIRATPNIAPGEVHSWDYNLGDPYWDLRLTFDNKVVNYATAFTVTVPVSETGAFSTGRLGLDWFNHFDKPIYRFMPYVNLGISNGLLDTRLLSQPFRIFDSFRSLGFLADAEGGSTFKISNHLSVGGSYYELIPSGSQKLYSANGITNFFLVPNGGSTSQITHDRGVTAFVRINPTRFLYLEPAYVHSLKFGDDAATLTLGFDLREMFRRH